MCIAFIILNHIEADIIYRIAVKCFLMPLLILWVWFKHGGQAPAILYIGLGAATLGDFFLDFHHYHNNEGPLFLVGMGFFLMMQLSYIRGFRQIKAFTGVSYAASIFYIAINITTNLKMAPLLFDI